MATTKTGTTYGPTSSMATERDVTAKGRRMGGRTSLREGSLERVSDWSFKSEQHAVVRSRGGNEANIHHTDDVALSSKLVSRCGLAVKQGFVVDSFHVLLKYKWIHSTLFVNNSRTEHW